MSCSKSAEPMNRSRCCLGCGLAWVQGSTLC